MPHVIIKLRSGRTPAQKSQIAEHIAAALVAGAGCAAAEVSVSIEDVAPQDWLDAVYRPEILGKPATLVRKPGYDPFHTGAEQR